MKRTLTVIAISAALLLPGWHAVSARQEGPPATVTYVVRPGDTLWRIARELPGDGNVRARVYEVMESNGLDSAVLQPGQKILLPRY